LQERLGIADRKYFRLDFLVPAMEAGLVEMTIPDKPRSSKQRYRLTDLGRRWQAEIASRNPDDAVRDAE
jgi:ATP-dependent DNA helicase RecG